MAPFQLSEEQLAKQAQRRAAKEAKAAAQKEQPAVPEVKATFLKRDLVRCGDGEGKRARVTLATWNVLAQKLVRRDLFPGSDCLSWKDREALLLAEIASLAVADVIVLQEVDRLEAIAAALPEHTFLEGRGPGKQHGCVIFWRTSAFEKISDQVVQLDAVSFRDGKTGGTRRTKNIGLFVALKGLNDQGSIVVCTTHLFWSPLYTYERSRQLAILVREGARFRSSLSLDASPFILAGDLNTEPEEPSYSMLLHPDLPLSPSQQSALRGSMRIHSSLEPQDSAPAPAGVPEFVSPHSRVEEDDEEGAAAATMKGTRAATAEDGLLSEEELRALFREGGDGVVSLYQEGQSKQAGEGRTFGSRLRSDQPYTIGLDEPNFTSYTPLWHLTLDYILLFSGKGQPSPTVLSYLQPHRQEDLDPGLPRKGVSASDHVALLGEVAFD